MEHTQYVARREPWNKGKIVGQKAPLKLKDIWALRVRLTWNAASESSRYSTSASTASCVAVTSCKLKVRDVCHGEQVAARAIVMQQKTQRPCSSRSRQQRVKRSRRGSSRLACGPEDFLFPSRIHDSPHLGTRQYARILEGWVEELGLDAAAYGTHSIRRTKPTMIYRRTKNLGPFSCCSGTPSWRAPSAISVSRSTMRSKWRNKRRCDARAVPPGRSPARSPRTSATQPSDCTIDPFRSERSWLGTTFDSSARPI